MNRRVIYRQHIIIVKHSSETNNLLFF